MCGCREEQGMLPLVPGSQGAQSWTLPRSTGPIAGVQRRVKIGAAGSLAH